jgi:hypothetical protein
MHCLSEEYDTECTIPELINGLNFCEQIFIKISIAMEVSFRTLRILYYEKSSESHIKTNLVFWLQFRHRVHNLLVKAQNNQ